MARGPTQFNIRNSPPRRVTRYAIDGNHHRAYDVYDPADEIPSPRTLRALMGGPPAVML